MLPSEYLSSREVLRPGAQIPLLDLDSPISWLPDETAFSLASRFHLLSGNVDPKITSQQLFGTIRGGFPHDLPGGLAHCAQVFGDRLGTARKIICRRTVLPFLLAFKSADTRANAIEVMARGSIGSLKATLGLLASRFGANLPLKACIECMESDRAEIGVQYWHLQHQLPGAWVCRRHGSILRLSTQKMSGQARYHWMLPRKDDLSPPLEVSVDTLSGSPIRFLTRLSDATVGILHLSIDGPLSSRRVATVLKNRMIGLELASTVGRLRVERVFRLFGDQIRPLRAIRELSGVASTKGSTYTQITRLLAAYEDGCHPLRVAVAVACLFDCWDAFLQQYSENELPSVNRLKETGHQVVSTERHELNLLISGGMSVSRAAKQVGVQVATAQAWLAQAGIGVPKRPSTVRGEVLDAVKSALRHGEDKETIAERLGISLSSVNRIMRTELGLHHEWAAARRSSERERAREQWLAALEGAEGIKSARLIANAAYAWLYRNDRAWLSETNGSLESVPRSNNASIDWERRDTKYLEAARRAVLTLRETKPKGSISITDIFQLVPDLRAKYRRIHDLPRTALFLKSACTRREHRPHNSGDLFADKAGWSG